MRHRSPGIEGVGVEATEVTEEPLGCNALGGREEAFVGFKMGEGAEEFRVHGGYRSAEIGGQAFP